MGEKAKGERRKEAPGSTLLLIGFIIGIIIWAVALGIYSVLMAMVSPGAPPAALGLMGTFAIVALIPGAIGWILTIIAWRRVKKGESGFGFGLAGGILMLTLYVVPGILAIVGAALSRGE